MGQIRLSCLLLMQIIIHTFKLPVIAVFFFCQGVYWDRARKYKVQIHPNFIDRFIYVSGSPINFDIKYSKSEHREVHFKLTCYTEDRQGETSFF